MKTGLRQTRLGIDELIERAKDLNCGLRCFYMNEIGIIFIEEGDEKAADFLLELLDTMESERYYAYCFLSSVDAISPKARERLERFRNNPDNVQLIEDAKEDISFFKERIEQTVNWG